MSTDAFIEELWGYAKEVPMKEHPWFRGIVEHRWTREQIVQGEVQHYLRVRTNPIYFSYILANATADGDYDLLEPIMDNIREEFAGAKSHVDIMYQFLEEAGISKEEADLAEPTPGTLAAIETIVGCCQRRSALEGIAMLAFVEAQHGGPGGAADSAYKELIGHYGFSKYAAATYEIHAVEDVGHGSRQIEALARYATNDEMRQKIRRAVQLGVTAFSLEWDGHVQAMTGKREFWEGVAPLNLRQPKFKLPAPQKA